MAKNSSPSRAPKNGAQRQCELTEREKCRSSRQKKSSQPPGRHNHRHTARRNTVQTSSTNLRVDADHHAENMKFSQKLAVPGTAHRNNVQAFRCELPWNPMEAASESESTFHVENQEIRP